MIDIIVHLFYLSIFYLLSSYSSILQCYLFLFVPFYLPVFLFHNFLFSSYMVHEQTWAFLQFWTVVQGARPAGLLPGCQAFLHLLYMFLYRSFLYRSVHRSVHLFVLSIASSTCCFLLPCQYMDAGAWCCTSSMVLDHGTFSTGFFSSAISTFSMVKS